MIRSIGGGVRLARQTWTTVAVVLALVGSRELSAQGTLSTQGLGFPPGQLSTQALSMGGSLGESDAFSPLNPASIGLLTSAIVFMQSEPEFRNVTIGGVAQRSSVARFPLFLGSMPLGTRWAVGLSASTLLDRTWQTTTRDSQFVGSDTVFATVQNRSDGSITDVRLAASYATTSWLRIGIAGHAYSGRDVLTRLRVFDDTTSFINDSIQTTVGLGGNAVSFGLQTVWPKVGAVGVSYRIGGTLRTYNGDSVLTAATVPDHFGVSLVYLGITGATLAVRAAHDGWSNTSGLSPDLSIHEAWDFGLGADVTGPKFGGAPVGLRAGMRWRTLPYSPFPSAVTERAASIGAGFPMARGRVELHMGLVRAWRSTTDASENSWTLSTGFAVRP
ncbi:MAG TPA: hypothetical protein VFT29_17880 [Gemmatimonadaceae bacterium]|nr:hypothetical protein [Gemmatimonadaceae bacterium]